MRSCHPLKSEDKYPNIAVIIESGGKIEIGEDQHFSSLIRVLYDRDIIAEIEAPLADLGEGLIKTDAALKKWIASNW